MKLGNGKISILIGRDSTTIEIIDGDAAVTFVEVTMTPEQLSAALSRQAHVPCQIEVSNLRKIGLQMELNAMEFEIPEELSRWNGSDMEELYKLALKAAPDGWTPDNYFGSQDSFFTRDKKRYARVTIRRHVQITDE